MTNDIDINEELRIKHQEMLLNKKLIDIDTSVDSLLLFINNYFNNLVYEINNKINDIRDIDTSDEMSEKMIDSFLKMIQEELKKTLSKNVERIKSNMANLNEDDYNRLLSDMTIKVANHISDFYLDNVKLLADELSNNVDVLAQKRVNDYLTNSIFIKIMNTLKDQLMYSIKVIDNNYEENYQIIQSISEKTIKQV